MKSCDNGECCGVCASVRGWGGGGHTFYQVSSATNDRHVLITSAKKLTV